MVGGAPKIVRQTGNGAGKVKAAVFEVVISVSILGKTIVCKLDTASANSTVIDSSWECGRYNFGGTNWPGSSSAEETGYTKKISLKRRHSGRESVGADEVQSRCLGDSRDAVIGQVTRLMWLCCLGHQRTLTGFLKTVTWVALLHRALAHPGRDGFSLANTTTRSCHDEHPLMALSFPFLPCGNFSWLPGPGCALN